ARRAPLWRLRLWKATIPMLPQSRYAAGIPRAQHVDCFVDRERGSRCGECEGSAQVTNSDLADVWARSLDGLADLQIQPHQRAWLKLTRPLGLVENTALIATPNEFVKEQLETRLRALITQALSQQLRRDIPLAVTVDPAPQGPQAPVASPSPVAPHNPTPPGAVPAGLAGPGRGADLAPESPAPRLQGLPG